MTWLAANWGWIVVFVWWLGGCACAWALFVGACRGRTESAYSPEELRRVRDFARDDTH